MAVVFFFGARGLATLFSEDPKVLEILVAYIRIISFGYGMMEVHRYCGFILPGLHRPVSATLLNAVRVLAFLIPLSYLGARLGGVRGVFFGRLATDLAAGSIGLVWVSRVCGSAPVAAAAPRSASPASAGTPRCTPRSSCPAGSRSAIGASLTRAHS